MQDKLRNIGNLKQAKVLEKEIKANAETLGEVTLLRDYLQDLLEVDTGKQHSLSMGKVSQRKAQKLLRLKFVTALPPAPLIPAKRPLEQDDDDEDLK